MSISFMIRRFFGIADSKNVSKTNLLNDAFFFNFESNTNLSKNKGKKSDVKYDAKD